MRELNIQREMIERLIYLDRAIKESGSKERGEGNIALESIRRKDDTIFEKIVKYKMAQKLARHEKILTNLYDGVYSKIINQEI